MLPDAPAQAWQNTRTALERAGFTVTGTDQGKGMFYISYHDSAAGEKKGFLSKLAFWKKSTDAGKDYALNLSAAGAGTQVAVQDDKGAAVSGNDAEDILSILRNAYNQL